MLRQSDHPPPKDSWIYASKYQKYWMTLWTEIRLSVISLNFEYKDPTHEKFNTLNLQNKYSRTTDFLKANLPNGVQKYIEMQNYFHTVGGAQYSTQ